MTSHFSRLAQATLAAFCLVGASAAVGADYPASSVTVVVPYSPGGGVDTIARIVTQRMAPELKQSMVVDNKPGAGTNIGMSYVARANPDGYTLYAASNTITTNKALYADLPFDPMEAFAPIGKIGEAPLVVVVNSNSPIQSLRELIDAGRQNPDSLTFGTAGMGSSGHMASELLLRVAGFKAMHVPYKGGSQAVTDLLAGRLSFMAINPIEVVSHVEAGKLRPLAVLNKDGTHLLPDLKTAASMGVDVESTVWWGLVAPAGTPADVVGKLNAAFAEALRSPDVKEKFAKLLAEPAPNSPQEFAAFLQRERGKYQRMVQISGAKVD